MPLQWCKAAVHLLQENMVQENMDLLLFLHKDCHWGQRVTPYHLHLVLRDDCSDAREGMDSSRWCSSESYRMGRMVRWSDICGVSGSFLEGHLLAATSKISVVSANSSKEMKLGISLQKWMSGAVCCAHLRFVLVLEEWLARSANTSNGVLHKKSPMENRDLLSPSFVWPWEPESLFHSFRKLMISSLLRLVHGWYQNMHTKMSFN